MAGRYCEHRERRLPGTRDNPPDRGFGNLMSHTKQRMRGRETLTSSSVETLRLCEGRHRRGRGDRLRVVRVGPPRPAPDWRGKTAPALTESPSCPSGAMILCPATPATLPRLPCSPSSSLERCGCPGSQIPEISPAYPDVWAEARQVTDRWRAAQNNRK